MLETMKALDNFLPWVYAVTFFIGVLYFRALNSFSISAAILTISEFTEKLIKTPLMVIAESESLGIDVGKMVWAGTWLMMNMITIAMIKVAHERLNLSKSFDTKVIEWYIASISALLIARYLSSITVQIKLFAVFYAHVIPMLNAALGVFIIFALMWNIFDVDFKVSLRTIPRG